MAKMQIKVRTGYNADQYCTIGVDEAHKAYYLFLHPEARAVFSNGVALIGRDIQGIEPDWNATMGWHSTHKLDGDDWHEIRGSAVEDRMRSAMIVAKDVSYRIDENPRLMEMPLKDARELLALPKP